jgi:hypothetical protein
MPKKKGEDEPTSNAHDPGAEHEDQEPQVGHGPKHRVELGHFPQLLRKHFCLFSHFLQRFLLLLLFLKGKARVKTLGKLKIKLVFFIFYLCRRRAPVLLLHVGHGHVVGVDHGVPEGDLRGHDEGASHQEEKDGETNVIVSLRVVNVTLGVHVTRVVQDHTHDKHEHTPADGAKHTLLAILVLKKFKIRIMKGIQ